MSSSLCLPSAPQSELLRSHQKDQYYENMLYVQVEEVLVQLLGNRTVLSHSAAIKTLTAILYYALNTMHTRTHTATHSTHNGISTATATTTTHFYHGQTLGEEYCDIRPVTALPTLATTSSSASSALPTSSVYLCVIHPLSVVLCASLCDSFSRWLSSSVACSCVSASSDPTPQELLPAVCATLAPCHFLLYWQVSYHLKTPGWDHIHLLEAASVGRGPSWLPVPRGPHHPAALLKGCLGHNCTFDNSNNNNNATRHQSRRVSLLTSFLPPYFPPFSQTIT